MEFYTSKPFEDNEKPDKTGESNTSKKKKKTPRGLPLPVEKETSKQEQATEKLDKKLDKKPEEDTTPAEIAEEKSKEQVETTKTPEEEAPFLGELVIDHTEDEPEPLELPEVQPTEAEPEAADIAPEPVPEQELVDSPAAFEDELVEPLTPQPGGAGEQPPLPPLPPVESSPSPRFMPDGQSFGALFNPNEWRSRFAAPEQQPEEPMVPETEAHRRSHRAEKRGLSRGVTTGALAGWWLGRRSGRNQTERTFSQRIQTQDNQIERLGEQQKHISKTLEERESAFQRAMDRLRSTVERNWDTKVFNRNEPLVEQNPAPESAPSLQAPEFPEAIAQTPEVPTSAPELPKPPVEELPVSEELYEAPEGRRYEASAWHRIEVDEKTGRLVEQPSTEYGEAFQQEQQQERLAREAAQAQTAAQVAMALSAAGTQTPHSVQPEPPVQTMPVEPKPPLIDPDDLEFAKQQLVRQTTNPATWAVALVIFLLLLATGAL